MDLEKLAELLKLDKKIVEELLIAFALNNFENFLGFVNSFYYDLDEIKREGILLKRKIARKLKSNKKYEKLLLKIGEFNFLIKPTTTKDRVYIYLYKGRKKFGPIGEIVANEEGLDIYPYRNKIEEFCNELGINPNALEAAIKAIKNREEFNLVYNLNSKVRTIYEIKHYQERTKKEEKEVKREKKKLSLELLRKIDRELIETFKSRETVKKEEIEKLLSKYGLTLDEFLHLSAIYNLEFASEFYEPEEGVFKRIG